MKNFKLYLFIRTHYQSNNKQKELFANIRGTYIKMSLSLVDIGLCYPQGTTLWLHVRWTR